MLTNNEEARVVVSRKVLWSGGTISIAVPADASAGFYPSPEGNKRYVQFAQNVEGGLVNFFVHGENPTEFCGTRIIAKIAVLLKTFDDGQKFDHVDLLPVQNAVPTLRLAVMPKASEVLSQKGVFLFKTPKPLRGAIALVSLGTKILTKPPVEKTFLSIVPRTRLGIEPKRPIRAESFYSLSARCGGSLR